MKIKLSDSADRGHGSFVFKSEMAVLAKKFTKPPSSKETFLGLSWGGGGLGHGSEKTLKI